MICAHPRCAEEIVTPVKARLRDAIYHSSECRARDSARLKQQRRRDTLPAQREYERRHKLLKKYGITEAEWDVFFTMQEGRCTICAVDLATVKVCVDHNHATGEVRGLLCNTCNQGLGYFGDDPDRLLMAAAYLVGRTNERAGEEVKPS